MAVAGSKSSHYWDITGQPFKPSSEFWDSLVKKVKMGHGAKTMEQQCPECEVEYNWLANKDRKSGRAWAMRKLGETEDRTYGTWLTVADAAKKWPEVETYVGFGEDHILGAVDGCFITVSEGGEIFACDEQAPSDKDLIYHLRAPDPGEGDIGDDDDHTGNEWVEISFAEYNWLANKDRKSGQAWVKKNLGESVVRQLLK